MPAPAICQANHRRPLDLIRLFTLDAYRMGHDIEIALVV
jgi:hypothetical protein